MRALRRLRYWLRLRGNDAELREELATHHALLLARVPVPTADALIQPRRDLGAHGFDDRFLSEELRALAVGPTPLTGFAGASGTLDANGAQTTVAIDAVAGNYFDLLQLGVARGRGLSKIDEADAARVVVLTDRVWRGRLNADEEVLGRTVQINQRPYTVVGITRPGFAGLRFPATTEAIAPYRTATLNGLLRDANGRAQIMTVVGRRDSRQSPENAQRTLAAIWQHCCADGRHVDAPRGQVATRAGLSGGGRLDLARDRRRRPRHHCRKPGAAGHANSRRDGAGAHVRRAVRALRRRCVVARRGGFVRRDALSGD